MSFDESVLQLVGPVSRNYGPTSVTARQFFLSWNSVLTIAYEGFSQTLLDAKRHFECALGRRLRPENMGSRWPKTTLGCLNDGMELTLDEVRVLRRVADEFDSRIAGLREQQRWVPVSTLTVVKFACRTLEERLECTAIPLEGRVLTDDAPPRSHLDTVNEVMAQFGEDRLEESYPNFAPAGRTIGAYYRAPHTEMTLVADVEFSPELTAVVEDFKAAVDQALQGRFAWFDPESWHMTVRALVPA